MKAESREVVRRPPVPERLGPSQSGRQSRVVAKWHGVGSSYQCYHGNRVITQVVVEWRPLERVVLQMLLPFPGRETYVHFDFRLTPIDSGTLLSSTIGRPTGPPVKRWLARLLLRARHRRTQHEIDTFRDQILEDQVARGVGGVQIDPVPDTSISDAAAAALEDTGGTTESGG